MEHDYGLEFNELWDRLLGTEPPASPVRIQWNAATFTPHGWINGVDLRKWLTPLHWAVCARAKWDRVRLSVSIKCTAVPEEFLSNPLLRMVWQLHPLARPWLRILPMDDDRLKAESYEHCNGTSGFSASDLLGMIRAELTSDDHRD